MVRRLVLALCALLAASCAHAQVVTGVVNGGSTQTGPSPTPPGLALYWPRPTLTNPLVLVVDPSSNFNTFPSVGNSISHSQDCLLIWPASFYNGQVSVNGCNNVQSSGGYSTITPQGANVTNNPPSTQPRIGLWLNDWAGVANVEGHYFKTNGSTSGDAMMDGVDFNSASGTGILQIQNDRFEGIYGWTGPTTIPIGGTSQWAFHGDCVQIFPGSGTPAVVGLKIRVYNTTCSTAYQGFFVGLGSDTPVGDSVVSAEFRNVNVLTVDTQTFNPHSNGGIVMYNFRNLDCTQTYPTTFSSVYLAQRVGSTLTNSINSGVGCPFTTISATSAYLNNADFTGFVSSGVPPGGDYMPASLVGLNYIPPAAAVTTTMNTAFVGNELSDLSQFEGWLGKSLDGVQLHGGRASRADYTGSWNFLFTAPQIGTQTGRTPIVTVPMFIAPADDPGHAPDDTLAAVAGGSYDTLWANVATQINNAYPTGLIYVRTGEEFNGGVFPWAATPATCPTFIAAWQRMRTKFAAVLGSRALFEWNVQAGQNGAGWNYDWRVCYPGDAFVDVMGIDFYWVSGSGQSTNPATAFSTWVNATYGLQTFQNFAAAHSKAFSYHEWGQDTAGIGTADTATYQNLVKSWFTVYPPLYQGYWNFNVPCLCKLSGGAYPIAGAAYIVNYGP